MKRMASRRRRRWVMLDRDGKVAVYNPGQLTAEQLEPLIQKITAVASSQ